MNMARLIYAYSRQVQIKKITENKGGISFKSMKDKQQESHRNKYYVPESPCEKYIEEFTMYGNTIFVAASQTSSFYGLVQNLAVMEQLAPQCVLIDHFSYRDLKGLLNFKDDETSEQKLIGKSKYTKLFVDWLPNQLDYFQINDNNVYIYKVDDLRKVLYFQDQLSVAYFACNDPKTHIIVAKPDQVQVMEDMVNTVSLDDLKGIFYTTIDDIKEQLVDKDAYPLDGNEDILHVFRDSIKRRFPQLFIQYTQYQSALLHKVGRMFNKSCLFTSQYLTRQVVKQSQEEYNEIDNIFQSEASHNSKDELLEKLVIVGYIVDYTLRIIALKGGNPFSQTMYHDYLSEQDIPRYLQLHQKYTHQLHELQNFTIKSLLIKEGASTRTQLYTDQLNELQQRKQRVKYEFDICQTSKIKQSMVMTDLMKYQMEKLITSRRAEGINQKDIIKSLQEMQQETYTQKNVSDYMKLLMESNAQLGSPVKFPGSLKEKLLPYLSNVQMEKVAKKISGMEFKQFSKKLSYSEYTSKDNQPKNDNEFSDDEGRRDENQFMKQFIIGGNDKLGELPKEFQSMTLEQLQEQGELVESVEFDGDEDGEIELKEKKKQPILDVEELMKGGTEVSAKDDDDSDSGSD